LGNLFSAGRYLQNAVDISGTQDSYIDPATSAAVAKVGLCRGGSSYHIDGLIDELRISNIARSAAWLKATKESSWDSLLTFGDNESLLLDTKYTWDAGGNLNPLRFRTYGQEADRGRWQYPYRIY